MQFNSLIWVIKEKWQQSKQCCFVLFKRGVWTMFWIANASFLFFFLWQKVYRLFNRTYPIYHSKDLILGKQEEGETPAWDLCGNFPGYMSFSLWSGWNVAEAWEDLFHISFLHSWLVSCLGFTAIWIPISVKTRDTNLFWNVSKIRWNNLHVKTLRPDKTMFTK